MIIWLGSRRAGELVLVTGVPDRGLLSANQLLLVQYNLVVGLAAFCVGMGSWLALRVDRVIMAPKFEAVWFLFGLLKFGQFLKQLRVGGVYQFWGALTRQQGHPLIKLAPFLKHGLEARLVKLRHRAKWRSPVKEIELFVILVILSAELKKMPELRCCLFCWRLFNTGTQMMHLF